MARLFEKFAEKKKAKKLILILTLCFNAGLLVLLKDAIFFTNLLRVPAEKFHVPFFQRLAPIGKKIPIWCAFFVSWFLIGFWHGGYWNFIIGSGLYYCALIILGEFFKPNLKKLTKLLGINTESFSWRLFQRVRTFLIFMMGASLFRFREGFLTSRRMYKAAFNCWNPWILFDGSLLNLGVTGKGFGIIFIGIFILLFISFIKLKKESLCRKLKDNKIISIMLSNIMILLIFILGITETSSFIYFQF